MSEQRAATLNLVHRIAMGVVVNKPDIAPIHEAYHASTGDIALTGGSPANEQVIPFTIGPAYPPVSDVTITLTARAMFLGAQPDYCVTLVLGSHWYILGELFSRRDERCPDVPLVESITVDRDVWCSVLADEPEPHVITVYAYVSLPVAWLGQFCQDPFLRMEVDYRRPVAEPIAGGGTWYVVPMSRHKTRVTKRGQPYGVPHFHPGRFVINRRTGKLLIAIESHGSGPSSPRVSLSGFGVAPGDENGEQIPTHASPGTFESLTTGRLRGRPVRITVDQTCPQN